jgi:phosphoadenosine phosphosulfate reductase
LLKNYDVFYNPGRPAQAGLFFGRRRLKPSLPSADLAFSDGNHPNSSPDCVIFFSSGGLAPSNRERICLMPTATKNRTSIELEQIAEELEPQGPEATLRWMVDQFHPSLYVACSFQQEESVLLDMLHRIEPDVRIFYLDTDVLFDETYETRDRFVERYGFKFERYHNISLAEQAKLHGDELWKSKPDVCCSIRKVEPLQRALGSVDAWVTGIRRDQAPTRANSRKVEWDDKFGLVKANPLADWTLEDVWAYIHEHDVPYNPLHDRNYPSIGCTHCTRQVMPGEDPRAGRWAGQEKVECGLHPAEAK